MKIEDIFGHKVGSNYNSLLRLNEENTFVFAYVTIDHYLSMQKFKIVSNDGIKIIKTLKENIKSLNEGKEPEKYYSQEEVFVAEKYRELLERKEIILLSPMAENKINRILDAFFYRVLLFTGKSISKESIVFQDFTTRHSIPITPIEWNI